MRANRAGSRIWREEFRKNCMRRRRARWRGGSRRRIELAACGLAELQALLSRKRQEHDMAQTVPWTRRHLLGLEELTRQEIVAILDTAETFAELSQRQRKKRTNLSGKVVVNLFFEPSTRTRTSFGLAARRLSADVLDFTPASSSLSKGETFIDTAKNIEAMGIDLIVVRHASAGAPHLLANHLQCGIINAGD